MKKSVAVLLTGLMVGLGFVNASNADDRAWAWSPVGIGLAAPIQLPYMTTDVYGLRLGGFFGANNDVYGLDLGVAEYSAGDFAGLQASALSWTQGRCYGVQLAAFANVVREQLFALQMAPVNVDWDESTGVQFGCVNYDNSFVGIEVGALINWNCRMSYGLEVSTINANQEEFLGAAFGGLVNYAQTFTGFACGLVNVAYDVTGCQLGLINACDRMHGVQIGLLNLINESKLPVMVIANAAF